MPLTGTPSWSITSESGPRAARAATLASAPAQIWSVGGGKGGIGKSFIASNMATVAARSGARVVLIDVDFGGANLHTCLGVRTAARVNLSDYLEERVGDLEKVAIETPVPGLRLILGTLGHTGTARTNPEQRLRMMEAVRRMAADVVVFDLAAGMDRATIDFFVEADQGLVVTTPEPTAIENAYSFLRAAFYRRLSGIMKDSPVRDLMRESMDQRNARGIRTPVDLLEEIRRIDCGEAERFEASLRSLRPRLILNQVRTTEEVKLGFSIRAVCRRFYGMDLDYAGYINYDDHVWRSIKERRTLVLAYPSCDGALYLRQIAKKLLAP
jgi:flagellar biosynthesis protein FlhG